MSGPAIIVGLGGTGQRILTWLKADLLVSNGGKMPSQVRLLAIDTTTPLDAGVEPSETDRETIVEGAVKLTPGEFISLGGEILPMAEDVLKKARPLPGWFQAGEWLKDLSPADLKLNTGAGQMRQFGRLALFGDILGQGTQSKIWSALQSAIEAVKPAVDEEHRLEMIVAGSFAGGTGSGIFVDVALILRTLAKRLGVPHQLRGLFALPDVFMPLTDSGMRARAFAAWRELNRFMLANEKSPMPKIQSAAGKENFQLQPEQKLFDACYLVDGKHKDAPVGPVPKSDAFSTMGQFIRALLEEKMDAANTQMKIHLMTEYVKRTDIPKYAAVGSYTAQPGSNDFFEESLRAYEKHMTDAGHTSDPVQLHVFPAEALAARYERAAYLRTHRYNVLHPRIVALLEDPSIMEQFLYVHAMGWIHEIESSGICHWELRLKKDEQTIWLTAGWNEREHQAARPKPDLLDAAFGYVILKRDQNPAGPAPIDGALIQHLLDDTMKEMAERAGCDGKITFEIQWLKDQVDSDGLVSRIRSQVSDPITGQERKEYMDLADLAEQIFMKKMEDLDAKHKET